MKKLFLTLFIILSIIIVLSLKLTTHTLGKYVNKIRVGSFVLTIGSESEVYLFEGENFNQLVKNRNSNTIIFDIYDNYPDFRNRTDGTNVGTYLDKQVESDKIKLFYENNTIYVLSENIIKANPNSQALFKECASLSKIEFNAFDTSEVINAQEMFGSCTSLRNLNISCFNTKKVTNMSRMFFNCRQIRIIYVSNEWSTESVTNGSRMFFYCINIEGSRGTEYNRNRTDHTYARIDGGRRNPGYLTRWE